MKEQEIHGKHLICAASKVRELMEMISLWTQAPQQPYTQSNFKVK
jgi:hypothetical protein